jgi:ATP-dependent Clp protease adaptor protein ClpS
MIRGMPIGPRLAARIAPRLSTDKPPRREREGDVVTEVRVRPKSQTQRQRPPLYKVLLHNDDFTPMEFVVAILEQVFQKSESDAMAIMLHAHTTGMAVAGVFAYEIAEAKVEKVTALAKEAELPLLCTMEPESDSTGDVD